MVEFNGNNIEQNRMNIEEAVSHDSADDSANQDEFSALNELIDEL